MFRPRKFAAQGKLVVALFDVELLYMDLTIIKGRADHYGVGRAVAPRQAADFRPKRASRIA